MKGRNGGSTVGFRVDSGSTGLNGVALHPSCALKESLLRMEAAELWPLNGAFGYLQWALDEYKLLFPFQWEGKKKDLISGFSLISSMFGFQQPLLEVISALKCIINIKRDVKSIEHCGIMCFQLSVSRADSDRCLMTNIIRLLWSAICSWCHKNRVNLGLWMTQKDALMALCVTKWQLFFFLKTAFRT